MAEKLKDFHYYADQAEFELRASRSTLDGAKLGIAKAEVYARLAASAPPNGPCTASLTAVGPTAAHDRERPCIYQAGHADDHLTADGVRFHR